VFFSSFEVLLAFQHFAPSCTLYRLIHVFPPPYFAFSFHSLDVPPFFIKHGVPFFSPSLAAHITRDSFLSCALSLSPPSFFSLLRFFHRSVRCGFTLADFFFFLRLSGSASFRLPLCVILVYSLFFPFFFLSLFFLSPSCTPQLFNVSWVGSASRIFRHP